MRQAARFGVVVVVLATLVVAVGQAQGQVPPPPELHDVRARVICGIVAPSGLLTASIATNRGDVLSLQAAGLDSTRAMGQAFERCMLSLTSDADDMSRHLDSLTGFLTGFVNEFNAEQARQKELDARIAALEKRTPPDTAKLTARLAALEGELAALKGEVAGLSSRASTLSHRVTAPFEVVDASGELLLEVANTMPEAFGAGVRIGKFNGLPSVSVVSARSTIAYLGGGSGGAGRLSLRRPGADEGTRVFLDATESQVAVTDGQGMVLATMLAGTTEGPVVGVLAPDGNTLAGIGSNENGGRVFANFKDNSMAFKAGAQPGGDADTCVVSSKRGLLCLRARLF